MFAESISGERKGVAYFLMSSLFNHVESFFPFCDTTYNGVIGKVSSSLSCARKKLVTGKMLVLSIVASGGFTVSVE